MGFLRWVSGLSLRHRARSSVIREGLGVEPLLLRIERSQVRWLGHLVRPLPPPRKRWRKWPGTGTSGLLCSSCCPHDPTPGEAVDNGWI